MLIRNGLLPLLLVAGVCTASTAAPTIEFLRIPSGGLQPEGAIDADGNLHLLYFAGEPAAGDLYYTRPPPRSLPPPYG